MKQCALALAVAAALAGGCGVLPGLQSTRAPAPVSQEVLPANTSEAALAYFEHVHRLAPAELGKEHDKVRQLYAKTLSEQNRMRYAIIVSVPGTPYNDETRALEALDPLIKNPEAQLHRVAVILNLQIQEQRRGRALQQKLDALMSLDKNLAERAGKAEIRR